MATAAPGPHPALHARLHQAEKALKAARLRDQRARAELLAASGAAAVARRMVAEFAARELRRAAAEVTAAAEGVAAADSRQIPLLSGVRSAPRQAESARAVRATAVRVPAAGLDAAEPLLAWARAHGAGSC